MLRVSFIFPCVSCAVFLGLSLSLLRAFPLEGLFSILSRISCTCICVFQGMSVLFCLWVGAY